MEVRGLLTILVITLGFASEFSSHLTICDQDGNAFTKYRFLCDQIRLAIYTSIQ